VSVGVIAVDGTKLHANASRDANLDYEQVARKVLEEAAEVDEQEDERYGENRGDELPPTLARREGVGRGCARRASSLRTSGPRTLSRSRGRDRNG
jgi:hypothetical protein